MNLTDFLQSLEASHLVRLYDHQWTVQAVFRSLPPVAMQYALRLLFVDPAEHVPAGRERICTPALRGGSRDGKIGCRGGWQRGGCCLARR